MPFHFGFHQTWQIRRTRDSKHNGSGFKELEELNLNWGVYLGHTLSCSASVNQAWEGHQSGGFLRLNASTVSASGHSSWLGSGGDWGVAGTGLGAERQEGGGSSPHP